MSNLPNNEIDPSIITNILSKYDLKIEPESLVLDLAQRYTLYW